MFKRGILKLILITFVFSYIIVTLYNGGAVEVIEGYNRLFNAPIEQEGQNTILNINEFRKEPSIPILFADMKAITWENGVEKKLKILKQIQKNGMTTMQEEWQMLRLKMEVIGFGYQDLHTGLHIIQMQVRQV